MPVTSITQLSDQDQAELQTIITQAAGLLARISQNTDITQTLQETVASKVTIRAKLKDDVKICFVFPGHFRICISLDLLRIT